MLVIAAARHSATAPDLATRWAAYDARVLTSADLSMAGWRHRVGRQEDSVASDSTAVIGGQVVAASQITGVLTCLPCVTESELTHIAPADRAYVAAEMTAFLMSWLASLNCPVFNRPSPGCLCGPYWPQAKWVYLAARLGIPIRALRHQAILTASSLQGLDGRFSSGNVRTVTVVENRFFGAVTDELRSHACRLATASGIDLLAVHFDGDSTDAEFMGADCWPDVTAPDVADAILASLLRGNSC